MKEAEHKFDEDVHEAAYSPPVPLSPASLWGKVFNRKNAEAIADENNKYRELIEHVPAITYLAEFGADGRWLYISPQVEPMLGFTVQEWMKQPDLWYRQIHPSDRDRVLREEATCLRTKNDFFSEYRILTRSGKVLWVSDRASVVLNERGTPSHVRGVMLDITDRKLAQEQHADLAEGLRHLLQVADELMAAPDVNTLYKRAVELGREKLGLERCGILIEKDGMIRGTFGTDRHGQTVDESQLVLPKDGTWQERMRRYHPDEKRWLLVEEPHYEWNGQSAVQIGQGWVAITPILTAEHQSLGIFCNDAAISAAPPDLIKQEVIAVYCSLLGNIIGRKRAEEERQQAEESRRDFMERADRLHSLGLLAAGMGHEINNPLQAMISHLHIVKNELPANFRESQSVEMIERAIESMSGLIKKLLVLGASQEPGGDKVISGEAIDFVTQLLDSQFKQASVQIEKNNLFPTSELAMNRRELIQVLLNLMINARDAMRHGGTLRITNDADNEYGIISIQDSGEGISPAILRQIFTPFFTTKGTKGTGLGLSVAESLVRGAGGALLVESRIGRGTTFTLRIPRVRMETT